MSIADTILEAARKGGLDQYGDFLVNLAQKESGLDPYSRNSSSGATGLFQFIPSTWRTYGRGNPTDPAANAAAAVDLTKDNISRFRSAMDRDPSPGEVALMHQQGVGGALKLLENPTARAADLVGEKAVTGNGGDAEMRASDFVKKVQGYYGGKAQAGTARRDSGEPDPTDILSELLGGTKKKAPEQPIPGPDLTAQQQPSTAGAGLPAPALPIGGAAPGPAPVSMPTAALFAPAQGAPPAPIPGAQALRNVLG